MNEIPSHLQQEGCCQVLTLYELMSKWGGVDTRQFYSIAILLMLILLLLLVLKLK